MYTFFGVIKILMWLPHYQKILLETICSSEIVIPNTLLRKLKQSKKKPKNNSITVIKLLRALSKSSTRLSHHLNLVFESVPASATCSHVFLAILFFIELFHIPILLFCCCFLSIYACASSSIDRAEFYYIIFSDILMFYQIFFSPQVKRLLLISMVYTSCLTSCRTTYDLGSQEIRKYHETA